MHQIPHKKNPVYVSVYDSLYDMISDGTFPVGMPLPSEPKLSEMLGISRMTLRQALELLCEDGMVEKIKGKGNFVTDPLKPLVSSLEKMGNPIHKCLLLPLDEEVEIEFRLEPQSEFELALFKHKTAVVVAVDRWYRSAGKLVGYSLSLIPIETITKLNLDLNDKQALLHTLEHKIYDIATRTHIRVQMTWVGSFISDRYVLTDENAGKLNLIFENIYSKDDFAPMICNKHYMLPKACSIEINAN